jgi:NifB/MoaA-like Fe-S oxidoreductase
MIERLEPIDLFTQVVALPGRNDGEALDLTLDYLASRPNVQAVAVVPVGLTDHRRNLPAVRTFTPAEADAVVTRVEAFQRRMLAERGTPLRLPVRRVLPGGRPAAAAGRRLRGLRHAGERRGMVRDFLDGPAPPSPPPCRGRCG